MKLYNVKFESMWPVPSGLVVLAENEERLKQIIKETINHTNKIYEITEIPMDKESVVFYESGDY